MRLRMRLRVWSDVESSSLAVADAMRTSTVLPLRGGAGKRQTLVLLTSTRRRSVLHRHVAALVALAALAVQVVVPHVHTVALPEHSAAAAVGRRVADCSTTVAAAASRHESDADRHSPASCPLCRAQRDARASLVPTSSALPFLATDHVAMLGADAVPPRPDFLGLAAPRAPPVVS